MIRIAASPMDRNMPEAQFGALFLDMAHEFGWAAAHFRPALTKHGWRTAVQGDGTGWPDWFVIHVGSGDCFATELKVRYAKPDPQQKLWALRFAAARIEHHFWWPPDWPEIVARLARPLGA